MRVICIDDSISSNASLIKVKFGEVYEVVSLESLGSVKGYALKGIHPYKTGFTKWIAYKVERFIPLSDTDERQFKYADPIKSTFILKEV